MAFRFEFDRRALAEADEAYRWIAEQSPGRAARWYRGLFKAIEGLQSHPLRCPLAGESEALGQEIREMLYGKRRGVYRVLFAVRADVIRILAIRHSARGPYEP